MLRRMNYVWRLFATTFGYIVFGLGGLIATVICALCILVIRNPLRRQKVVKRLIHLCFKLFVNLMDFLRVLSFEIEGKALLKEPGRVILANHPSLLDVVFLISCVPQADCVVKSRLLRNPFMCWVMLAAGYIANDQPQTVVEKAAESLQKGNSLIVFPEGTRTKVGNTMTMQRGAANIAIRVGKNITPVVITCKPSTLTKENNWYEIPSRRFHVSLMVKDEIDIQPFSSSPPSVGARDLTQYLLTYFSQELANA
ncbi:Bifunctional protein Aas [Thalassocella blandensis]|nr:Bifunctional protein Aas [Thalassocella blandensis]